MSNLNFLALIILSAVTQTTFGTMANTDVCSMRTLVISVLSKLDTQEHLGYFFDPSGNLLVRKSDNSAFVVISFSNQPMYNDVLFEISLYDQVTVVCYNIDSLIDEVNRLLESYGP